MLCDLPQELTSLVITHIDDIQTIFNFEETSRIHFFATHRTIATNPRLLSLFLSHLFVRALPQHIKILLKRFSCPFYSTPYALRMTEPVQHPIQLIQLFKGRFPHLQKVAAETEVPARELCSYLEDDGLHSLHLYHLNNVPRDFYVEALFSPRLRSLKICNSLISDEGLQLIFARCTHLSSLTLGNLSHITSAAFSGICLPRLRKLTLWKLPITKSTLKLLLKCIPQGAVVKISHCPHITGKDKELDRLIHQFAALSLSNACGK